MISRYLWTLLGSLLLLGSCATGSAPSEEYFMPPDLVTQGSVARTEVYTVDLSIEPGPHVKGIWKIAYELDVPARQLQENAVYFPYPANRRGNQGSQSLLGGLLTVESSSTGQTYKYWIVHTNTVQWLDAEARLRCSITNTSDKSARLDRSSVEISSVPGVRIGERLPSSVGPGKTVSFELARIDLSQLKTPANEATPIQFRFVDLPLSLNQDGSVREISFYEENLEILRSPFVYTSEMTLTPVHTAGAMINGQDGKAHYLAKSTQDTHWSSVTFDPIDLHFGIEIEGRPLVRAEPHLWQTRQNNAVPYNFGTPQRGFAPEPNEKIVLLE